MKLPRRSAAPLRDSSGLRPIDRKAERELWLSTNNANLLRYAGRLLGDIRCVDRPETVVLMPASKTKIVEYETLLLASSPGRRKDVPSQLCNYLLVLLRSPVGQPACRLDPDWTISRDPPSRSLRRKTKVKIDTLSRLSGASLPHGRLYSSGLAAYASHYVLRHLCAEWACAD